MKVVEAASQADLDAAHVEWMSARAKAMRTWGVGLSVLVLTALACAPVVVYAVWSWAL